MLKHPKPNKIIVFDLDETLGCFTEISIFWNALENFYGLNLLNESFYDIIDLFSDFLRPNILNILEYIKDKKINNECDKVMIYTNNQGPKSWVNMISTYFNNNISPNTEICFIDDQYHPLMNMDNVYYINVKPYYYSMPYEEMAEKYYNHQKDNMTVKKEEFITYILNYMNQYNYPIKNKSEDETELDKIISKKIVIHLEEFFKKSKKQNTRKRKVVKNRLTKRKF